MKSRRSAVSAAVLATLLLLAGGAPRADDATTQVAAKEAQRRTAMVAADTVALDTLLAPACTYTHSTGRFQTRADFFAMIASGDVRYVSFDTAAEAYRRTGDCVAATGRQTIELVVRGAPVTSVSRYTAVWTRTAAGWRCVAYQSTSIPQEGKKQ